MTSRPPRCSCRDSVAPTRLTVQPAMRPTACPPRGPHPITHPDSVTRRLLEGDHREPLLGAGSPMWTAGALGRRSRGGPRGGAWTIRRHGCGGRGGADAATIRRRHARAGDLPQACGGQERLVRDTSGVATPAQAMRRRRAQVEVGLMFADQALTQALHCARIRSCDPTLLRGNRHPCESDVDRRKLLSFIELEQLCPGRRSPFAIAPDRMLL
jgi:hypothetical protein